MALKNATCFAVIKLSINKRRVRKLPGSGRPSLRHLRRPQVQFHGGVHVHAGAHCLVHTGRHQRAQERSDQGVVPEGCHSDVLPPGFRQRRED